VEARCVTLGDLGQRPDKAIGLQKQVTCLNRRSVASNLRVLSSDFGGRSAHHFDAFGQRLVPLGELFEPLVDGHDWILASRNRSPQVSRDVLAWAEVSPILGKDREREPLLLGRHLLLDFPPSTDLETPADPAEWFGRPNSGFRATNRTQNHLLQAICRN
jgi:hypothetical protein